MSQFNFKDFVFAKLFPSKFYHEDTYKDENNEGILQRFISVCSEYLDENVLPDIDNFMDILDIDETPDVYLGILWEFFGYIPYAYSQSIDNLNKYINDVYPKADTRTLLKYAISLYKIRCTPEFYQILASFYNIQIDIEESSQITENIVYDNNIPYDGSLLYDSGLNCIECIELKVTITIPNSTYADLVSKGLTSKALDDLCRLFNKYLPLHVKELDSTNTTVVPESNYIVTVPPDEYVINYTEPMAHIIEVHSNLEWGVYNGEDIVECPWLDMPRQTYEDSIRIYVTEADTSRAELDIILYQIETGLTTTIKIINLKN